MMDRRDWPPAGQREGVLIRPGPAVCPLSLMSMSGSSGNIRWPGQLIADASAPVAWLPSALSVDIRRKARVQTALALLGAFPACARLLGAGGGQAAWPAAPGRGEERRGCGRRGALLERSACPFPLPPSWSVWSGGHCSRSCDRNSHPGNLLC